MTMLNKFKITILIICLILPINLVAFIVGLRDENVTLILLGILSSIIALQKINEVILYEKIQSLYEDIERLSK